MFKSELGESTEQVIWYWIVRWYLEHTQLCVDNMILDFVLKADLEVMQVKMWLVLFKNYYVNIYFSILLSCPFV